MAQNEFNYCPRCGTHVNQEMRFGKVRPVCPQCGWIHFVDPKVAAAVLIEEDGRVLLVRRQCPLEKPPGIGELRAVEDEPVARHVHAHHRGPPAARDLALRLPATADHRPELA